jgi:hypothetical protein
MEPLIKLCVMKRTIPRRIFFSKGKWKVFAYFSILLVNPYDSLESKLSGLEKWKSNFPGLVLYKSWEIIFPLFLPRQLSFLNENEITVVFFGFQACSGKT